MKVYYENVAVEELFPGRVYIRTIGSNDCHFPLHWHRDVEIDFVTKGKLLANCNGTRTEVLPGEFYFVNSGELHETDAEDYRQMNTITVILSYKMLKLYCKELDQYYFDVDLVPGRRERIGELVKQCGLYIMEKPEFYQMELAILLRQIGSILLRDCLVPKKNTGEPSSRKNLVSVKSSMAYIEENFTENITLEEISGQVGMVPTYFSRYFKQMTGQTFHEYLNQIRLFNAYNDLMDEDMTITDIALKNGFANVKSFIETFKKTYELTPDRYRQQQKDKK